MRGLAGSLGSQRSQRILVAVLLAFSLGFYAVNAIHFGKKPLRIEEGVWPPMSRALLEHGVLSLPDDEDHRVRVTGALERVTEPLVGLWHPPLYTHSLATAMLVLGDDAAESLRLVGALGLLTCCALLFLLARELARRRWLLVGGVASALLLVHPYAIQGSMFLDIDTTVYAPTFLFFAWVLVRCERDALTGPLGTLAPAVAFALVLWAKIPTAFVLAAVVTAYWIARHGPLRGLARAGLVCGSGAAIFLATYGIYVGVTGQPFWFTFDFTLVNKGDRLVWEQGTDALEDASTWHLAWFQPALVLLALAYGIASARRWVRDRSVNQLDFVWGLGLAIWLAYAVVSPQGGFYQGKYAFPALPLLIFAVSAWLLDARRPAPDRRSLALAATVALLAALAMPDLLTERSFGGADFELRAAIVLGSAAALWIAARGLGRATLVPVGALLVCFALFVGQSIDSYRADTSPLFPVKDTADFEWAASLINENLGPGELALVSKDTGYYVDGEVIEGQTLWHLGGDEFEARLLRQAPEITVVGGNSFFDPVLGPETADLLADCFALHESGRSKVWVREPRCGG